MRDKVLTEPKNALLKQYRYLFHLSGVELHITDCALKAIAEIALSKNTGARGLRAILEVTRRARPFEACVLACVRPRRDSRGIR